MSVETQVAYLMPNHALVLTDLLLGSAMAVVTLTPDYLPGKLFETDEIDGGFYGLHSEHAHNHGFLAFLETFDSH